ncbi:sulfotransferase [Sphaerotilaceae bacterium SBD11-9]
MSDSLRELQAAAEQLLQAGRVPEAIAAYQRLLKMQPALPDAWYNLAYLQHHARRYEDALASYDAALRCGIQGPEEVRVNRAVILAEHLKRSDAARAELEEALRLAPRHLPALVNLGNIHEQCGEREQALARYEAALAVEPANALALSRLPNLKRVRDASDPLIERLRRAVARPGIGFVEQADLGFGLGKALDDAGAYDEAFTAYAAANQASRRAAGPSLLRHDRAAHEQFVDRLIALFDTPARSEAEPGRTPVFICGMFRSGSTLIEQILGSHPRVTAGGEIDLLPAIARQHLGPHLRDPVTPFGQAELEALRTIYREGIALQYPQADILTDKRPDNFLYIGLIKQLFPTARILHTQRSVLDNCLSVYFLHLSRAMPYAFDLEDIAHWYRQYRRLMDHWKSLYGDDIHDVDYDTLVIDPRPQIEGALAHLGLGWDDACLNFHATRSAVMTPSAWQVRQPLYQRSSGRWRHYEKHLGRLRHALGEFAVSQ